MTDEEAEAEGERRREVGAACSGCDREALDGDEPGHRRYCPTCNEPPEPHYDEQKLTWEDRDYP